MNSRIKEFVTQADKYANDICDTDANADWYDTRDEKFAELIVQECAHQAEIWDSEPLSGNSIAYEIRKYFGVEE